jgi:alkanesulfonate monooxygenase SsuD/methylene tetrahydromethanopterin reductase-like flavin-dependent oxidoreductase (luciferase family)
MKNQPMFGVFLSTRRDDAQATVASAVAAETAGFDYVSLQDHPYHGDFLDPILLISYIGAATERLQLMTNVVNLPLRPPAMLAKTAATLDVLSGGRFILGLGGGRFPERVAGLGGPTWAPGQIVTAVDEAITILHTMWSATQNVSFAGRIYTVDAEPGPHPGSRIGIWLGGIGTRMMQLLGAHADGWIAPIMADFAAKPSAQDGIDRAARAAGRSPADIRRVIQLVGEVSSITGVTARPREGANNAPISTTPAYWARIIAGFLLEERFDTVNFIPVSQSADQVRRFGTEVIPRVRELISR